MPPSAAGIARSLGKGQVSGGLRSDIVTIALIPAGTEECNLDCPPSVEPAYSAGLLSLQHQAGIEASPMVSQCKQTACLCPPYILRTADCKPERVLSPHLRTRAKPDRLLLPRQACTWVGPPTLRQTLQRRRGCPRTATTMMTTPSAQRANGSRDGRAAARLGCPLGAGADGVSGEGQGLGSDQGSALCASGLG